MCEVPTAIKRTSKGDHVNSSKMRSTSENSDKIKDNNG